MRKIVTAILLALTTLTITAKGNLYKHKVKDAEGREISLKKYKGQVLLIINSATKCGFTPQYTELEALYQKYKDRGFTILDFPCNQFGAQAPGSNDEIHAFCTANFDIHFPQFDKVEVNGPGAAPLFTYLKAEKGFQGFGNGNRAQRMDQMLSKKDPGYAQKTDIKWNFTKFLVDKKGRVVQRFEPTHDMTEVDQVIAELLK